MSSTHRFHGLRLVGCATLLAIAPAAISLGEEPSQDHSQHQPAGAVAQPELSEASKAYDAAMKKMHKDMSVSYTNDVDVDFVRGMVPHHQGAIEQAEVLLKYSKNPRLRRLAGGIIAAQRREIRFMQNWLKEHDQGVESGAMPAWMKDAPSTVEDARKSDGD